MEEQQSAGPQPTVPVSNTVLPDTGPAASTAPQPPRKSHKATISAVVVVLVMILAGGIFALLQKNKDVTEPQIKIGVMMPFSGGSSSMGYGAMKGIQLAKKQLSANNFEIIQEDSKCDPKAAAQAIKHLISLKVVAIIGEGCSSASVAALPAANNAKIPLISPSASSPTLSIPNDYFFRVVPPDTFQGSFMAQSLYDKGLRKVGVFYTNEPYGNGMNTVFREKFEALGGQVVATAAVEPDVIDLQGQVQDLKKANPEGVFIAPNSVITATAAIKLIREAGMKMPLFGADIMYDATIIANAGQAAEGLTISSFPTGDANFKQALAREFQKTEQLYATPQAYDITHLLQLAVKAGARSGEEIKNVLGSVSFKGVSGHIKLDQNGEISDKDYKYDLFQVKDGAFVLL